MCGETLPMPWGVLPRARGCNRGLRDGLLVRAAALTARGCLPSLPPMPKRDIEDFIAHWSAASASERSNSQPFLLELCDLLDVPRPDNTFAHGYAFEFVVTHQHADGSTSPGRADLYKRTCFVLESKQFQEAQAKATELELAAEEAGVIARKKSSQPVRGTGAWDDAMIKARGQAERYVRALPDDNPPFIVVVDVGHTFEIFADFTQAGKAYLPFPDPRTFRIRLADLADAKIRERLRLIWTDPAALDPARVSADVTREVSAHLAELAKSLEQAGHEPEIVAQFLTRCLFCMFAEDVELLPKDSFRHLLESIPADGAGFEQLVQQLFREMNTGTGKGISVVLRKKLLHFNGGLFADDTVLPINGLQLGLLKNAARQHWASVEPAIFGTLLERALNPDERHKLGAHFTPRAYVERLVLPTIIEPLRAEWANVRAAAITHARAGDLKKARAEVNAFHEKLCRLTVLDPACGVGNFLYVALQHLKIMEGEVLDFAAQFGDTFKLELATHTVDPHQFLGLEINPRAAAIAELVLWIGYLQWHFKLHGKRTPPEPILRAFKNIQCRDAVLDYDGEPQPVTWAMAQANPNLPGLPDDVRDQLRSRRGNEADFQIVNRKSQIINEVITVWDRKSTKPDMVTGREVPDETKRVPLFTYANPRPAEWPAADFLVGNPPFIGKGKLREDLGDGYAETLRAAYPEVPESADFVLYWWHKAATLVRSGNAQRFGFITTNSLRQTFARRVVQMHLAPVGQAFQPAGAGDFPVARSSAGKKNKNTGLESPVNRQAGKPALHPLSLVFAIPDHPWVDTVDGAAVRIAMTVGAAGEHTGELLEVTDEQPQDDGSEKVSFNSQRGKISADLTVGANLSNMVPLKANDMLASTGLILGGRGFVLSEDEAKSMKRCCPASAKLIFPLRNGDDLTGEPRNAFVIDTNGWTEEQLRTEIPEVYQHLLTTVFPERQQNRDPKLRKQWWLFRRSNEQVRGAIAGLRRFIVTVETSKHRLFMLLEAGVKPEHRLIVTGLDDAFYLGVLSSKIHVTFALAAGGTLEDRPVYNKSRCFDPFPFPLCGAAERERIRKLAEELDAHRKRVQAQHGLTLTGMYNVLEKLRAVAAGVSPAVEPGVPPGGAAVAISNALKFPRAKSGRQDAALYGNQDGCRYLTAKEKLIHDHGLVSVLKQLHNDLDAAVFAAYGWMRPDPKTGELEPENLTDQEILERLVALNAQRAAEEQRGVIHWLRPEYQGHQKEIILTDRKPKKKTKAAPAKRKTKTTWPKALAERVQAVEAALHHAAAPATSADLAKQFVRAKPAAVEEILKTLVTLGRARRKGTHFTS